MTATDSHAEFFAAFFATHYPALNWTPERADKLLGFFDPLIDECYEDCLTDFAEHELRLLHQSQATTNV